MKETILMGAGASVPADVPHSNDMTKRMLTAFESGALQGTYHHILCFVVGGLQFQRGINHNNPYEGISIEDVFNAISLLGTRYELEAAPFISSWHPLIDELDVIRVNSSPMTLMTKRMRQKSAAREIDNQIHRLLNERTTSQSIGDLVYTVAHGQRSLMSRLRQHADTTPKESPGYGRLFRETNLYMTQKLVEFVWLTTNDKLSYLEPLLRHARETATPIATLNYDNTIELASSSLGISIDNSLAMWSETGQISFQPDHIPYLKLHGSIDWVEAEPSRRADILEGSRYQSLSPDKVSGGNHKPAIIFGNRNKLTAKGPYLDLLREFKQLLFKSDLLTAIGYSFRDDHINEYIRLWMTADTRRKMRIITIPEQLENPTKFLSDLLRIKDRIVTVDKGAKDGITELYM